MSLEEMYGEEGYPWACKQCGNTFIPKKMLFMLGHPYQTSCEECGVKNILRMVFAEEPEEPCDP